MTDSTTPPYPAEQGLREQVRAAIGWANPEHRIRDVEALLDHHIVAARIDELERIKKGDFYSGDHEDDLIEIDNHIGRRLTELRQQYKTGEKSDG